MLPSRPLKAPRPPTQPLRPPQPTVHLSNKTVALGHQNQVINFIQPTGFEDALREARRLFPDLPCEENITLAANVRDTKITSIETSKEYWVPQSTLVSEVVVTQMKFMTESNSNQDVQFKLRIQTMAGRILEVMVSEQTSMAALEEAVGDMDETALHQQRLIWMGTELPDNDLVTIGSCGINPSSASTNMVYMALRVVDRKPIIYIMSPIDQRVEVELSLSNKWKFTTVYPITPIQSDRRSQGETVKWNVLAHSNGELTDESSGRDIAYLFWEAEVISPGPPSPPSSPTLHHNGGDEAAFDPSNPVVNEGNSVLLSVDKVPDYLDDTLQALGLHTEARTSFITYWLPDIQKHKHIALRFLPQRAYEKAAPLKITPSPDIVTRVLMLFSGVGEGDVGDWVASQSGIEGIKPSDWVSIVGVNREKALDRSLYRILEWGGMEVHLNGRNL